MVKPELGVKRVCGSCGAKFYDLNRDPILCPKCGTVFDVQAALKPRRAKAVVDPDAADLPEDVIDADDTDDEEEDVIEDTSELGEDDDDVAEVIEKVDDEGDR